MDQIRRIGFNGAVSPENADVLAGFLQERDLYLRAGSGEGESGLEGLPGGFGGRFPLLPAGCVRPPLPVVDRRARSAAANVKNLRFCIIVSISPNF